MQLANNRAPSRPPDLGRPFRREVKRPNGVKLGGSKLGGICMIRMDPWGGVLDLPGSRCGRNDVIDPKSCEVTVGRVLAEDAPNYNTVCRY